MTYYGPHELASAFRTVRKNTIQIAEEIPEANYGYRVTPDCRSVAETFVHIAVSPRVAEQIHIIERLNTLVGFDYFKAVEAIQAEQNTPRSKAQILDLLRIEGDKFAKILEGATEEFLAERVEYPEGMIPSSKSRFEMLMSTKEHEMHHRGQLMVIERLLGITPHLTREMQERMASIRTARASS
jgi:uncharacterized damage-inducible protein DinB